jgi:hypothetical protein
MAVTVLKKIYVDEAKHVAHDISARLSHWQDQTSTVTLRSRGRQMAAAFSLSQKEPHAACESTGMILAAESIPSPLQLMLVTPESGIGKSPVSRFGREPEIGPTAQSGNGAKWERR